MSAFLAVSSVCALIQSVQSNEPLDASWTPLPYGECTGTDPLPSTTSAERFSTTPSIYVCGFNRFSDITLLPKEYQDATYHVRIGQDVFNGHHIPLELNSTERAAYCQNHTEDDPGSDCARSCGVCFQITGSKGTATFIVVDGASPSSEPGNPQNAYGLTAGITSSANSIVAGSDSSIRWKRVPCSVSSSGISIYYAQWFWYSDIGFVIGNHRVGVHAVYARGNNVTMAINNEWIRVPLSGGSYYTWSSGISWISGTGAIHRGSANKLFDLKLVSVLNESIVCTGLALPNQHDSNGELQCTDDDGNPLQFEQIGRCTQEYETPCGDESTVECTDEPTTFSPTRSYTTSNPLTASITTRVPTPSSSNDDEGEVGDTDGGDQDTDTNGQKNTEISDNDTMMTILVVFLSVLGCVAITALFVTWTKKRKLAMELEHAQNNLNADVYDTGRGDEVEQGRVEATARSQAASSSRGIMENVSDQRIQTVENDGELEGDEQARIYQGENAEHIEVDGDEYAVQTKGNTENAHAMYVGDVKQNAIEMNKHQTKGFDVNEQQSIAADEFVVEDTEDVDVYSGGTVTTGGMEEGT